VKKTRWIFGMLGIVLVGLSFWQIKSSANGLQIEHTQRSGVPITIIGPRDDMNGSRPLVLIGHGFAGSGTVMRGFAYTFAHAGYVVALWDFDGHAANPNPLPNDSMSGGLVPNAETTLAEVKRIGWADTSRLAILGHSMGSGVALSFGQLHPETAATIAVSPVGISVTPELPHNLLLLAGSLEPQFASSAESRLSEAGGPGGDTRQGTARKLAIIAGVEHISIVFSPTAHATALNWLNDTFGIQPGAVPYTDRRIVWFGIGLLGTLLASVSLIPRMQTSLSKTPIPAFWKRLLALTGGALVATLVLWAVSLAGMDISRLLGLRVGGYLFLWFFLAGLTSLLILFVLNPLVVSNAALFVVSHVAQRSDVDPLVVSHAAPLVVSHAAQRSGVPTQIYAVISGLLIFASLWIGFALFGGSVWLPWLLILKRLVLWPLGIIALLPWFLAVGRVSQVARGWGKMGWWLFQSILLITSLMLAIRLTPALGFLTLILPIFPIILFFHTIPTLPHHNAWSYAISGATFVSWLLLAVFPLI